MFTLIRLLPASRLLRQQLPSIVAALVIAELFFKWGSFTLECLGFLATWAVLDFLFQSILTRAEVRKARAK